LDIELTVARNTISKAIALIQARARAGRGEHHQVWLNSPRSKRALGVTLTQAARSRHSSLDDVKRMLDTNQKNVGSQARRWTA